MRRRVSDILLIILGLTLVLSGAWLYARYTYQAKEAEAQAQVLLQELKTDIKERQLSAVITEVPVAADTPEAEQIPEVPAASVEQMPQTTLQGVGLIGILQAKEANIQLSVLENWSYANMDKSPCRYAGSLSGGDLVLIGHNYKGHLADLDLLEEGDPVEFIDVDGKTHSFEVAQTTVLQPAQVEELLNCGYPLAIVTCTPGGRARFAVYCKLTGET